MKYLINLILVSLLYHSAYSQNKTTIVFNIIPRDAGLIIDGKKYHPLETNFNLGVGKHNIKLWKPNFSLLDTTFELISGQNNIINFQLKHSDEYITYQNFKKSKRPLKLKFIASSTALIGLAIYAQFRTNLEIDAMNNTKKRALDYRDRFGDALAGFSEIRDGYNLNYDLHKKAVKNHNIYKGVFIGSLIGIGLNTALFYFLDTFERYKKPKRENTPREFASKFTLQSNIDSQNNLQIGFNYNLR